MLQIVPSHRSRTLEPASGPGSRPELDLFGDEMNRAPPARLAPAREMTGRRRAEYSLLQTQERLQFLLNATPVVIYSCQPRPPYAATFIGENVKHVLGYEAQVFLADPDFWASRVHPDDVAALRASLERGLATGESVFRYRFRHKDGSYRWMRDDWRLVRDEQGAPSEIFGSWIDVTERKQVEEALRQAQQELEGRVQQRTAELQAANQALVESRERFQREILHVAEREQRRLGADLHDDLGQQLVGIEFLSNALEQRLRERPESARAGEIASLIRAAIDHTRRLARGLAPIELESEGLVAALKALAAHTSELFRVRCEFRCASPTRLDDLTAATHLYRIAQEAVTNSIKHGRAGRIEIGLALTGAMAVLAIEDDGVGLPKTQPESEGMGWRIMRHRAGALGGRLSIENRRERGTRVSCVVPLTVNSPNSE
jgi:PAS domain S-box-containing protein